MAGLSKRVRSLVRDDVASLSPYDPNFTPCRINLSANENTYDMPAKVRAHQRGHRGDAYQPLPRSDVQRAARPDCHLAWRAS